MGAGDMADTFHGSAQPLVQWDREQEKDLAAFGVTDGDGTARLSMQGSLVVSSKSRGLRAEGRGAR
jgi:hypothetical protein